MILGGRKEERVRWENPETARWMMTNARVAFQAIAWIATVYSAFGPAIVTAAQHARF